MVLRSGDVIGPYVVVSPAGSGGMGEVYKARDTRLNRMVALKIIGGQDTANDQSALRQRFANEARAIAALSHTHICAIHDVGSYEGRNYLVLEYLEGESLAERLARGALPGKELLTYAIQIADALEFAHRRGVIHRDLKPSNVFICRGAGIKLLDFGLAKMRAAASDADTLGSLSTEPLDITTESAIVGTLPYLAPERLEGRPADVRSDIFAYGAILYEMVAGRKAYDAKSQAALIAAILKSDPPPFEDRSGIPPAFSWIVQHCLAKDPDDRWQAIGDVAKMLKNPAAVAPSASGVARGRLRPWLIAATALAMSVLAALAGWALRSRLPATVSSASVVFEIPPPAGQLFAMTESTVRSAQLAISPNGQTIAFVVQTGGEQQLWVRGLRVHELSSAEPRALPGTEGASYPFWSPDSRSLGFFAKGSLRRVDLNGGPSWRLCQAPNGRGGAWHEDGTIVFSPDTSAALHKVSDASGACEQLTSLGNGHVAHRWPQFLPGGDLLFFVRSVDAEVHGIYVTSLARPGEVRQIKSHTSSGVYSSGMLLYEIDGNLVAQRLDAGWTLSGKPAPLGPRVTASSAHNLSVSASSEGALATWDNAGLTELVWFDRNGTRLSVASPAHRHIDFRLSPDDQRLAVSRVEEATNSPDLGVLDLKSGDFTLLSSSRQTEATPVWSPDGGRIVFRTNRVNLNDLYERPAAGSGDDRLLYSPGVGAYPTEWSAENGAILFHRLGPSTKHDIWKLDVGRKDAEPVLRSSSDEVQAQLAPGGRLAYTSDEAGVMNVYVRRVGESARPIKVSVNGGFDPRWRADGRELFYVSPEGSLMAAELSDSGPLRVLRTQSLFKTSMQHPTRPYLSSYVVTRDASRFLINEPITPHGSVPITVTLHWPALLRNSPQER